MSLSSPGISTSPASTVLVKTALPAVNLAEKELLLCIRLLTNDDMFLPVSKHQVLSKAIGKNVAVRLHLYERIAAMQEKAFQCAVAAQQRDYQQRLLNQWNSNIAHKKNGIGAA